jgi:Ca2+-dependent lipid-binding protein
VVLHYGGERKHTSIKMNEGKTPCWGESFAFPRTNENTVRVEVWDKDKITKDDLVGEGYIDLHECMPGQTSRSVNLLYKGKCAGTLNVNVHVEGGMGMGGPSTV